MIIIILKLDILSLNDQGSTRVTDRAIIHVIALIALRIFKKFEAHSLTISVSF